MNTKEYQKIQDNLGESNRIRKNPKEYGTMRENKKNPRESERIRKDQLKSR